MTREEGLKVNKMPQKDLLSPRSWNFEVNQKVKRKTKGQVKISKSTAFDSNAVADRIINAFIVKRRKALIDQEEFEIDLVSYEASEKRLIILEAILALSLCLVISILLALSITFWRQNSVLILQPKLSYKEPAKKHPYVMLLFKNGTMDFFGLNGTKLSQSWSFKVPLNKKKTGYFPYVRNNALNIIYSDKQKDVTVISGKNTHYTIKNSQIPYNFFYSAKTAQFGNQLWILGGQSIPNGESTHYGMVTSSPPNFNTLIWNTRKHRYYPGPQCLKITH